jgi:hypothetical protein
MPVSANPGLAIISSSRCLYRKNLKRRLEDDPKRLALRQRENRLQSVVRGP